MEIRSDEPEVWDNKGAWRGPDTAPSCLGPLLSDSQGSSGEYQEFKITFRYINEPMTTVYLMQLQAACRYPSAKLVPVLRRHVTTFTQHPSHHHEKRHREESKKRKLKK